MFEIKALSNYTSRWNRSILEVALISVLLLVLLCVYFWRVVFGGFVLVPTDMIFEFAFFKEAAPPGFQHAANALLSDAVLKFYPWHTVVREAFKNGQFPFWNPYIYAGTPLFANAESAILYPINFLGYLLPLNTALAFSAILRMFIAGIGMFLFLRAIKAGPFSAIVACITFMFGGSVTVWLNYPVSNTYVWMPLLFFLGERLLAKRHLLELPLISVVIAVQILGGHYQTSFIMLVAWSLYCVYRLIGTFRVDRNKRQMTQSCLMLAGAVVLGLTLAAVQLLPFWVWLQQTNETQFRLAERASSWMDLSFWKGLVVTLITLVLPNFFGNPTWGSPMSFFYSNYIETMVYMGIAPLALAIVATLERIRYKAERVPGQDIERGESSVLPYERLVIFIASLGLFFLGVALRLPGFNLVNLLPVFSVVAPDRYRLVFTFCIAILAGIGAERIFRGPTNSRIFRYLPWGLLSYAGIGIVALIAIHYVLLRFRDVLTTFNRIRTLYPILIGAFSWSNVSMYFPILIALLLASITVLYQKELISRQLAKALFVGLIVSDLFVFGMNFNPAIPENQVFPKTETVRFLQDELSEQDPARIVAMNDSLPANTGTPYQFSEIAGSDFPSRRYLEFAQAMGGDLFGHNRISFSTLQSQSVNLLNVKYIITDQETLGLPNKQFQKVYERPSIKIYENLDCLPRAYVVHQAKTVKDSQQILETLTSSTFDLRNQIVIEESPPAELPEHASRSDDRMQIVQYQSQRIAIQVELAENGFLFLSDVYYPGWQAFDNGEQTQIYRANYVFRAIYLPKGKHLVEFNYIPPGFGLGLAITMAGLILTLAALVLGWKKHTQRTSLQGNS